MKVSMRLCRPCAHSLVVLLLGSCGFIGGELSAFGAGSPAAPALELGYKFFNGPNESSGSQGNLQGSNAYVLTFRAENRKNLVRIHAAAQFEFASGTAPVTGPSASDAYSMYGAAFLPGFYVYPFKAGRVKPFIGGSGIAGWYMMNVSEAYTQALSFGYEIGAGVDLQFGSGASRIYRIRSAFTNHSASIGGNTEGVSLNGFMISLGIAY